MAKKFYVFFLHLKQSGEKILRLKVQFQKLTQTSHSLTDILVLEVIDTATAVRGAETVYLVIPC